MKACSALKRSSAMTRSRREKRSFQVPDTDAVMMSVETLRREIAEHGALHDLLGRYTQIVIAQMMQTTACNALHQVPQRCARWLLMTHDRMHGENFNLSHEFLAVMLGVQRPTVSLVAGTLQEAGLIGYTHGHVTVLDRQGWKPPPASAIRS